MSIAVKRIGPADHGKRMRLVDFDHADVQEGFLYELGRGRIVVSDVPGRRHYEQIMATKRQAMAFDLASPDLVHAIFSSGECKILAWGFESERHPDLAIYLVPPPDDEEDQWSIWIPALVIEIVFPGSVHRDYVEKAEEYLAFGVQEYWVIDADKQEVLVHRRVGGQWRKQVVKSPQTVKCSVLPGFILKTKAIVEAASRAGKRTRKK
jgi:hypothetical protein